MTVALLGIGTELTRGDLANTNGCWLAKELTLLGFEVAAIDVVDDEPVRIVSALNRLAATHEIIICTGGLGPTTDDLTTAAAASALGTELELHEASVAAITERLARFGRELSESNKKQAYFPRGAVVLPNQWGTAPGFAIRIGQAQVFFLPGVPSEMMALFEHRVVPLLGLPRERTPVEVMLRSYGLPESTLNDRLAGIADEHNVVVGYRVRFPEIDIKLHAKDPDPAAATARTERAAAAVTERLGSVVYGRGNVNLAGVLGEKLVLLGLGLGVAESCTGGLAASLLTAEAGASRWFRGGVVAYANPVKTQLLAVAPDVIEAKGAVSVEVARAMAVGVCQALGTEVGLGITGIAGPEGGSEEKPVGTVCFGIHGPFGTYGEVRKFVGDRQRVQRGAAFHSLSLLMAGLTSTVLTCSLGCSGEYRGPTAVPAASNADEARTPSPVASAKAVETKPVSPATEWSSRCNPQSPQEFLQRAHLNHAAKSKTERAEMIKTLNDAIEYRTAHYGYFEGFGDQPANPKSPAQHCKSTTFFGLPIVMHEKVIPALECVEEQLKRDCSEFDYRPKHLSGLRRKNTYKNGEVSNHVYGIAIDIDPLKNPCCKCLEPWASSVRCDGNKTVWQRMAMPECWVLTFERFGFYWLGHDVLEDTMHFEFLGDPDRIRRGSDEQPQAVR